MITEFLIIVVESICVSIFTMLNYLKKQTLWLCQSIISFTPWIISIYIYYWLDYEVWTIDTAHRGKLSIFIMTTGMILSLLVWTYIKKNKVK